MFILFFVSINCKFVYFIKDLKIISMTSYFLIEQILSGIIRNGCLNENEWKRRKDFKVFFTHRIS